MLITVFAISIISFAVIQLPPGDYVTSLVQQLISISGRELTPAFEQQMRDQYGLDQPMLVQYGKWVSNIVTKGKFGYSFVYRKDTTELVTERMPMTMAISLASFFLVWILALPIGIYSAVRQ
jgi:peptide/nickel transport system permease protein